MASRFEVIKLLYEGETEKAIDLIRSKDGLEDRRSVDTTSPLHTAVLLNQDSVVQFVMTSPLGRPFESMFLLSVVM